MAVERVDLVAARTRVGKSQEELAEAVGCSQQYISMIEAGTRNPGIQMAKKIADEVGEAVERLFPDVVESFRALVNNIPL